MHTDLTLGKPLTCSKCGSTNAVKPVNDRDVAVRCEDCGHFALTREARQQKTEREMREQGIDPNTLYSWQSDDGPLTF